jgi:hypothetical protein
VATFFAVLRTRCSAYLDASACLPPFAVTSEGYRRAEAGVVAVTLTAWTSSAVSEAVVVAEVSVGATILQITFLQRGGAAQHCPEERRKEEKRRERRKHNAAEKSRPSAK